MSEKSSKKSDWSDWTVIDPDFSDLSKYSYYEGPQYPVTEHDKVIQIDEEEMEEFLHKKMNEPFNVENGKRVSKEERICNE